MLPRKILKIFTNISKIHSYKTRAVSKQSIYLRMARTNYGKSIQDFKDLKFGFLSIVKIGLKDEVICTEVSVFVLP